MRQRPRHWLVLNLALAAAAVVVAATIATGTPVFQQRFASPEPGADTRPAKHTPTPTSSGTGVEAQAPDTEDRALHTGAASQQVQVDIVEGSRADPQTWGFNPPTITVRVGDTITWTNAGAFPHTVTADGGAFDSDIVAQGGQWTFTPSVPGTFTYLCALHPSMKGTLVVQPGDTTSGQGAQVSALPGGTEPAAAAEPAFPASPPVAPAPPPQAGAGRQVSAQIVASGFNPTSITVAVGDRLTWTNADGRKHTVTAVSGAFDSGVLNPGASWSFTATAPAPGTFSYVCDLHPEMRGTLVVTTDGGATAPAPQAAVTGAPATPQPPAASSQPEGPAPAGAGQHAVQIAASRFTPSTISVAVGETITWTNADGRKHTVTAQGGAFDSGVLNTGGRWSFTPTSLGTFTYFCDLHSEMQGTLLITPAGAAPAPATQPPAGPAVAPQTPAPSPSKAEIGLVGSPAFPSATGRARYETGGSERRLRVELEGVAALKGSTVNIFVGGARVGSMTVTSNGNARLELRARSGAATIPQNPAEQLLEIRVTGSGVLVASGRFP